MEDNQFQYALIVLGIVLVLIVFMYNNWQERRARQYAEKVFQSTHRDVLLEEVVESAVPAPEGGRFEPRLAAVGAGAGTPIEPVIQEFAAKPARGKTKGASKKSPSATGSSRIEPQLNADASVVADVSGVAPDANAARSDNTKHFAVEPTAESKLDLPETSSVEAKQSQSVDAETTSELNGALPWDVQAIDCAVDIEAPAGISAPALFRAQEKILPVLSKKLRWFGLDEATHRWLQISAQTAGSFNKLCVALQLVDRHGPISRAELDRFVDALQQLCEQFLAIPTFPSKDAMLLRASEIDQFCSQVDIKLAVTVNARHSAFVGTKLRGLAEASGLTLLSDGAFHACDEAGRTQFRLCNIEAPQFSIERLRQLQTPGVALILDVPCVAGPPAAYDRMMRFGRQLADSLGGEMVDDNKVPFGDKAINLIRAEITQIEREMFRQGMAPGSDLAIRLFA